VDYNDASIKGLGCVLMQHDKVIVYASRQLKPLDVNYMVCHNSIFEQIIQNEWIKNIFENGVKTTQIQSSWMKLSNLRVN